MSGKLKQLLGRIVVDIQVSYDNDVVTFQCKGGDVFRMLHLEDCCESVTISEIIGDLRDLLNAPILEAECVTNSDDPPDGVESHTWSFYKFGTIKGHVVFRWLGESNGYYSETVDFVKVV